MIRYQLPTKREAVNYGLRAVAAEPSGTAQALALYGSWWEGDLASMREGRVA